MKALRFLIIIFLAVFLFSCGEFGGTIIVENNTNFIQNVIVYSDASVSGNIISYKEQHGPKPVPAKGTVSFGFNNNTKCVIQWANGIYKTASVSNGETVTVTIP
jgi:outer membrane lipoprotein-sorting protein